MTGGPTSITFNYADGTKIDVPLGAAAPVPPDPGPPAFAPSVPADVLARLGKTPIFDETWQTQPQWGKTWSPDWFGGQNFNQQPLDSANVVWSKGQLSIGVSNGGKTGCMVNSNPQNPNSPGFEFGYGYLELDLEFSSNPAWAAGWDNGQSWPQDGEGDVVEWLSSGSNHIATSNYHSGGSSHGGNDQAQNSGQIPGTWTGRHRFGNLRTPDQFGTNAGSQTTARYWDGQLKKAFAAWDRGAPHYVILSIGDRSVGGNGPMICRRVTVWPLA